tara:strand:+ start:44 stop:319 length:276 start_codon:yes stop_codon:yes gene_type:complete
MSFSLMKDAGKNEKKNGVSLNKSCTHAVNTKDSEKVCEKKIQKPQHQDMLCLSNLEEIVFFTSTSRCLLDEMKDVPSKPAVEYDKYLDFFE